MTEHLTALDTILQQIVRETDPAERSLLADRYAAELRMTLRTISGRAHSVIWSEKDDILEQVGDTNTLVSRLLEVLEAHNVESREYRKEATETLHAVNQQLNDYITALPNEERTRLVAQITVNTAQIADHEQRITALEAQTTEPDIAGSEANG